METIFAWRLFVNLRRRSRFAHKVHRCELALRDNDRLKAFLSALLHLESHYMTVRIRFTHQLLVRECLIAFKARVIWMSGVRRLALFVNCKESIYLGISSHSLVLESVRLVNGPLTDVRCHVNLYWTRDLFISHRCIDKLDIAVFALIALLFFIERRLSWKCVIKIVCVSWLVDFECFSFVLLGPSRPSQL